MRFLEKARSFEASRALHGYKCSILEAPEQLEHGLGGVPYSIIRHGNRRNTSNTVLGSFVGTLRRCYYELLVLTPE